MQQRLVILRVIVVIVCALVLGRLVQLQVIEGRRNRQVADENRIRILRRMAPRGNIYDRHTRIMASSRPAFTVSAVPEELHLTGSPDVARDLATILELPLDEVRQRLSTSGPGGYESVILSRDAPDRVVARLKENSLYLSGLHVSADAVRAYPKGRLAAHVLGYVREISSEELARPENSSYRPLDLIGKAGVEKQLETVLRGRDGGEQIEVDAKGQPVRTLGTVPPLPGRDVWLTLDLDLQQAAETALGGRPGAVVALDPWTGEILALASSPTYDPNLFVGALSPEDWQRLTGPEHPQHNRATMSRYPPGSLFKIVTAAAALETHQTSTSDRFHCDGAYRIGSWALRCWKREGHGDLRFIDGFSKSCNVMFAILGKRVGPDRLADMAERFGLGRPCGIDLPEESSGLVPTPRWKRETRNEPWYPGDTCQMAVGQGDCLATPLQMACQMGAVANGGMLVRPHVVLRVEDESEPRRPQSSGSIGLRDTTIQAIQTGMNAVVAPGGTAARIAPDRYDIAGKTGTAQSPGGDPHAWFGGYAPAHNPRLAVAVIVEHGGAGSEVAAPIARYIFDTALLPPGERPVWQPAKKGADGHAAPAPLQ
ncbi:MAG: penicillin-binding protein 2 [Armatimonadetes bacterium]|nr:penicillin-binding protein 2 [Armatimonadota bacterium]